LFSGAKLKQNIL